ncbi:MAG: DUF2934 domain-containing protein [Gemmatimonadales bacterium]
MSRSKRTNDDPSASTRPNRKHKESPRPEVQLGDGRNGPLAEQERHRCISEAAYYRAERRGFTPGCELDDWLAAESEVGQASISQATLQA